ncbi:MAG: methyltransferase domain-containing protein [Desulfuromonadales bacterium]|jgi:arsenite methyltransferase
MDAELTSQDQKRIEESIRGKYVKVAVSPEGLFRYPTGRAGLEALHYDPQIIQDLPESVAAAYCGVGNPFTLGPIHPGEAILDIGCGAGVDSLIAARMAGPQGSVRGIDLVPEMLDRAKENARLAGAENIEFTEGSAEELPFPEASFDVVISNGVFNLVVDKVKALEEVLRVLKPGGQFMIADQVLAGELPKEAKARVENWAK